MTTHHIAIAIIAAILIMSAVPSVIGWRAERIERERKEQEALRVQRVLDYVHAEMMRDLRSGRTFEIDGDRNRVIVRDPRPHGRNKAYSLDRVRVSTLALISAARA